ncbi:MAG: flagellar basal body P-ring formation protein FlgA [Rhodospirillales bacterium]|nr:flagellar basal body P-ring formation protein FlgA [Rhodospirillales bacterium]
MTKPRYGPRYGPELGTNPRSVVGHCQKVVRRGRPQFSLCAVKIVGALALIALAGLPPKAVAEIAPKAAPTQAVAQHQLKSNIVTRGEMVVLGDLFTNAGPAAEIAVVTAPKPGESVYVKTSVIEDSAEAGGMEWRSPPGISRVLVTREGTPVPLNTIIEAVREEFHRRDPEDSFKIDIKSEKATLYVPLGADPTVVVEGLDHEIRNSNFTARLYLPGAIPGDQRVKLPGQARIMREIPVLAHHVAVGDVITEDDLRWIEMAADRMGQGVIHGAYEIIGQSPRRSIKPGKPVRFRDVQKPLLVTKGSLIKVIVQTPYMQISTTGKAMDSGAHGDAIRIQNTTSRQIVQAVVEARNRAYVPTASGFSKAIQ